MVAAARATSGPWRPRWKPLHRAFDRLEARPVQTIALLRLVLWLAPPLSYALASTGIRGRDHGRHRDLRAALRPRDHSS